jgi:hypothetical protein
LAGVGPDVKYQVDAEPSPKVDFLGHGVSARLKSSNVDADASQQTFQGAGQILHA